MSNIILDKKTFKALSSEKRISILHALDNKKMTLSEMSRALKMDKNTLFTHLKVLTDSGFIKRKQREGHKWVYYHLSWSGTSILHPEKSRLSVMITTIVFSIFALFNIIYYSSLNMVETSSPIVNDKAPIYSNPLLDNIYLISLLIIFVILLTSIIRYYKVKNFQYLIKK